MFEIVKPKKPATSRALTPDNITIGVRKGPSGKSRVLHIGIGENIARKLGLHHGHRVNLLWGSRAHAGLIRIITAGAQEEAHWQLTASTRAAKADVTIPTSLKLHSGAFPETYQGRTYPTQVVEHNIENGIEIALPVDFYDAPEGVTA